MPVQLRPVDQVPAQEGDLRAALIACLEHHGVSIPDATPLESVVRSRRRPVISCRMRNCSRTPIALVAAGLEVSSSLTAKGMVTIGWRGSRSRRRAAMTEAFEAERTRARSLSTRTKRSRAADAAVAVEVRMDGLELHVHECGADQRRELIVAMDVLLEIAQEPAQLLRRRRHEDGWIPLRRRRSGCSLSAGAEASYAWGWVKVKDPLLTVVARQGSFTSAEGRVRDRFSAWVRRGCRAGWRWRRVAWLRSCRAGGRARPACGPPPAARPPAPSARTVP
jgi:hypothetical protein